MEDLSIYSNRCWYNNTLVPATIVMGNGMIKEILFYRMDGSIDVGNSVMMPGVIDAHVHVNEPGRTEWEGFETATRAAAKGGLSTIIDMPLNAEPVTTTVKAFQEKLTSARDKLYVNCGFYGGLIPENFDQLQSLIGEGVMGIKCFLTHSGIDTFPNVSEADLNIALPVLSIHGAKLLVHCELLEKNKDHKFEKRGNYMAYMKSRPDSSETMAVELMIKLCRQHKCPIHIVHVSSAESLLLIGRAKDEGLPLTAETCPHYIYFNAEDIPDNEPVFKCAPPIRGRENNDALKSALKSGILDFLASDHSPAPPEVKKIESGNLMEAWGGIAGLQFLLSAGWTACRETMALEEFIPLLTSKPATFLGVDNYKGKMEIGFDADIVIWNPEKKFKVSAEEIEHRHKISPYIGEELFGMVEQTIVNGQIVYHKNMKEFGPRAGNILLNKPGKF